MLIVLFYFNIIVSINMHLIYCISLIIAVTYSLLHLHTEHILWVWTAELHRKVFSVS